MPPLIHPCPAASCPGKRALAGPSSQGVNWRVERVAGKRGARTRQGTATIIIFSLRLPLPFSEKGFTPHHFVL